MAGFAVIVRRSGEPVPASIIESVRRSLEHRAPDGTDVATRENVAVIFGRLHATPEARFERQPHECRDGSWLVADARIDNRSDLVRGLPQTLRESSTSDVELIAACYEDGSDKAIAELVGDFAIAKIDPRGRLTCFRDHLGVKPLYYWIGDDWIVIASELRQIAAHPDAPRAINVGLLGEYLSGWVEDATSTVVRDVNRLPAAHALVIEAGRPRTRRYWTPRFDDRIELKDSAAYEDEFLALFTEAVRCRMRSCGPVGTELSGGLDSTSVTAMASRLVRSGGVPASDVLSFSCLFPWSPRTREDGYIKTAVDGLGVDWTPVVNDPDREPWLWDDAKFWSDIPLPPDGPDHVGLCRAARDRGCSVVLTGHGGDQWFAPSHSDALLDLIASRRLASAWDMAHRNADSGTRSAINVLLRQAVIPRLPSWARRRRTVRRAPWVSGTTREEAKLDERPSPGHLPQLFRRPIAQRCYEHCAGGYDAMTMEILDRTAARAGVEFRHPYLDRRLVDFACRIPVSVHYTRTQTRRLQREGLREVLPPSIAERTSKASFGQIWLREIDRHLPDADWSACDVAQAGWVDLSEAQAAMERTRTVMADRMGGGKIIGMWGIVQAEAVVRALNSPPSAKASPDAQPRKDRRGQLQ
jgi:asparagine synthase (glutamine-hydrolysing)